MSKLVSSFFIFLLLLLSLWAFSAWVFGAKTKENIHLFLTEKKSFDVPLYGDDLQYELLELNQSLFSAKAKIALDVSESAFFSTRWPTFVNKLVLNIDIHHGPFFFDSFFANSGFSTGKSIWYISVDDELNDRELLDKELLDKLHLKQFPKIIIKVGFDENIQYELAIKSNFFELLLTGNYDTKTAIGMGQIDIHDFIFSNQRQRLKTDNARLSFKHINQGSNSSMIELSSDIPELSFRHRFMSKPIALKVSAKSEISLINNYLSSGNKIFFEQKIGSDYPIDHAELTVEVREGNLENLLEVTDAFSKLKNLHQQIDWILEEQATVPDGQDKIWQLQDSIGQLSSNIPALSRSLLMNDNKAITRFNLHVQNQNKRSSLTGEVRPLSTQALITTPLNIDHSFLSFFKMQANVNLDKTLLSEIASQLPIKKTHFQLIYKQNKLLMQ